MNYEVDFGPVKTPADKVVSLDLAKQNSNIDKNYQDEDDLFNVYLDGIADFIEGYLGYPVLERDALTIKAEWFSTWNLPVTITEITSIKYTGTDAQEYTLQASDYEYLDGMLSLHLDKPELFDRHLLITCTAGYPKAQMPGYVKNAALLGFTERETFRENRPSKPDTVMKDVLRPYRIY